jgi:hypothetical protein
MPRAFCGGEAISNQSSGFFGKGLSSPQENEGVR